LREPSCPSTAPARHYSLSLHDALPICRGERQGEQARGHRRGVHAHLAQHHRTGEGNEGAEGHHVAVGEVGEPQYAEHQRDADRAEGVDTADLERVEQPLVGEVHRGVENVDGFHQPLPPRNERATSGLASSASPLSVNRLVPVCSTNPVSAMASAWRAFCSTMSTPTSVSLTLRMMSKMSPITFGETPAVGSSSMSSFGSVIRARPTATICRWPPERYPAGCER